MAIAISVVLSLYIPQVPYQPNGHDCGIFTILILEILYENFRQGCSIHKVPVSSGLHLYQVHPPNTGPPTRLPPTNPPPHSPTAPLHTHHPLVSHPPTAPPPIHSPHCLSFALFYAVFSRASGCHDMGYKTTAECRERENYRPSRRP